MKLADVAAMGGGSVSAETLAGDRELAKEVQGRLTLAGLLDPPSDGVFGPVSSWALTEFCKAKDLSFDLALTAPIASALLDPAVASLFPLQDRDDLAGKIVRAMTRAGYWIARHPDCFNIVYVEGMNPDGSVNDNKPNVFNDLRVLLQISPTGIPKIANKWEGTTEPGRHYTEQPLDPGGAARIAFGQYKSWSVGRHHPGKSSEHEALVQVVDITIYRDSQKHYRREGTTFKGIFAINQHWGYDAPKNDLGNTSAGCLVGRSKAGHRDFMSAVKSDPRYKTNRSYRFMSAVFPASDI